MTLSSVNKKITKKKYFSMLDIFIGKIKITKS